MSRSHWVDGCGLPGVLVDLKIWERQAIHGLLMAVLGQGVLVTIIGQLIPGPSLCDPGGWGYKHKIPTAQSTLSLILPEVMCILPALGLSRL